MEIFMFIMGQLAMIASCIALHMKYFGFALYGFALFLMTLCGILLSAILQLGVGV